VDGKKVKVQATDQASSTKVEREELVNWFVSLPVERWTDLDVDVKTLIPLYFFSTNK
jgi:hypothetical protein